MEKIKEKEIQMVMNALAGAPTVCDAATAEKIEAILREHVEDEIAQYARNFYQIFKNGYHKQAGIVIDTDEFGITRFKTALLANEETCILIAESDEGTYGCWKNFFKAINPNVSDYKAPWQDGFNAWLHENFGFCVSYSDYLMIVLERD